jgi:hypothetical protein
MDTQKASAVLRKRLIEYATTEKIPEGWKVTLLVGGAVLSGVCVSAREFIESVSSGMAKSLEKEAPDLSAGFKGVDVSDLANDSDSQFLYLRCESIVASGVTPLVGTTIFRIHRSAITGVALAGVTSLAVVEP